MDLTQVGDDLQISETNGKERKRKANTQLVYYGIDANGTLSPLTYNAAKRAGARFYDTDGDGIVDFVGLTLVDGEMGDTGPKGDGKIDDPSTAGVVNLDDVVLTATDQYTLQAASKTNTTAPASLVLSAKVIGRAATVNQVGYVVLDSTDTLSFDSIFDNLEELTDRAQVLFSSLKSSNVLASEANLIRDILLVNGQSIRFFEVSNGTLDDLGADPDGKLDSASKKRLSILSNGGFSGDSRSVNVFSGSGSSFSLSLVDGDQGLNALINQEQGLAPVLDFTSFTADQVVNGTLSMAREASFDSVTGFYRTQDLKGTVWIDPTNQAMGTITPGQVGFTAADYGAAALKNMVDSLSGLQVGNLQVNSRVISLTESTYLAPIAQVKGHTFVAFAQGNQDGIGHFVTIGNGTFGLEDLYGGGDRDFNDVEFGFAFKSITSLA